MVHNVLRAAYLMFILCQLVSGHTDGSCNALQVIHKELNYKNRVKYMKDNMPISYTIKIQKQEVYRKSNITHLREKQNISDCDLQYLWITVNSEVLQKILMVLPEKHFSRNYTKTLFNIFDDLMINLSESENDVIQEIRRSITQNNPASWKDVKPKALLDNCYKVMPLIFNCTWTNQEV